MNRNALAAPASTRCSSSGVASVKNPDRPMNTLASAAPPSTSAGGPSRAISTGVTSAPSR
jgi:hypothetical protein